MPRWGDIAIATGASLVLVAVVVVAFVFGDATVPQLLRDPAATAGANPFTGAVSSLGAFVMFGAAAMQLWAALLVRRSDFRVTTFLTTAAAFTLCVCLDDFFMLHENVLPKVFGLGEKFWLLLGVLLTIGLLATFGGVYARFRPALFLWAMTCLGGSLGLDLVDRWLRPVIGNWHYLLEDGLKWFGLVAWAYWHVSFATMVVAARMLPICGHGRHIETAKRPYWQRGRLAAGRADTGTADRL